MININNITKPDIATLKDGDEILIRMNFVCVYENANFKNIVVKSIESNEYVYGIAFSVDSGCYFGKIEPEISVSVGDKFRQPNDAICEVIGIDGDVYWVKVENGFRCVLTTETLRDYERLPK